MSKTTTRSNNPDFASLVPNVTFTRRAFVITMLGAGFALATQPVMAETVIKTSAEGLVAGEIKVPVSDGEMVAYRAQPDKGDNFSVILVVSEIFGVHEHIADICRRLAKLGYMAIAPELFARYGDPRKISGIQDILANIVSKVPDAQVMSDLDACEAWAKDHGGDMHRLAITGFCWGGRITWLYAAHNPNLKAAVAWYGRLGGVVSELTPRQPLDLAAQLKAPVLGLYGGQDQGIPLDDVEAMRAAIRKAGGKSEIHVYPDAPHAFNADYRPSYRKDAAEDGWKRMQAWLKKNGM
ncbi:carboxymethylenebutenolidase [Sulfurimicrobium lacus]|uniref:Carboxymethylenebutenolidase n=1 Tax=Sulfurimicrobium lacus TaxID=2715678 RepID=A0A6F8VCB4_9PROT|nr:dienelactone hydrolase family protein [Sulfurimicrobium lacus]BCB26781.1 carboxymethylenebutenolidase [Sulfurimicrobium lacus]